MHERWSRRILLAEATALAAPLTILLVLLACLDITSLHIGGMLARAAVVLVVATALACLYFGWRLVFAFLGGGTSALATSPKHWWRLSALGAGLCAVGVLAFFVPWEDIVAIDDGYTLPPPVPELRCLALAMPLLIPYAHLLLERYLRRNLTIGWSGRER
jgi:hypothetical protein